MLTPLIFGVTMLTIATPYHFHYIGGGFEISAIIFPRACLFDFFFFGFGKCQLQHIHASVIM
jgi:hypothetical protein